MMFVLERFCLEREAIKAILSSFLAQLTVMTVVMRTKDTLKSLELGNTIAKWTNAEMTKLAWPNEEPHLLVLHLETEW